MFFTRCAVFFLINFLIAFNNARSAPILDGSAAVDNQTPVEYLKAAPENQNGRETVLLESEHPVSAILSVYDDKQKKVSDFLNPRPIIDTISEHEKYGNEGDRFYGIGRAIVNGYEQFANFMNKLLNAPGQATRSISSGITKKLDQLGGKLVGLAK
ncbi:uncharacterized protein LOC119657563 [Hermetia illucens]|nr:uncharacterized protein LOC119657563 [Hermetia illucens]